MQKIIPTYRLYRQEVDESADFWLHCEDLPFRSRPHRWEIDRHRHEVFFQILTIQSGGGEVLGETDVQQFSAPCAIIIPTGVVHGFRFQRESDGTVLTILADRLEALAATDRRLAAFFRMVRIVPLFDSDADAAVARRCLAELKAELDGRSVGRMALVEALLSKALVHLARAGNNAADELPPASDRDSSRIERLVELVDAHYREHRPVGFFAGRLGLSPTHLNRLARLHFGSSIQALIDRRLVAEARRALVFTIEPAAAVALSLGFSDPAYFNRFFRKNTGMTPGRFRASARRAMAISGVGS
ncbi:MAG: helix-turn-helix domain-containing protein [Rhizobiaceae bacterium]